MVTGGEEDADGAPDPRLDGLDVRSIDVYDQAAVKRTLDETISEVRSRLGNVGSSRKGAALPCMPFPAVWHAAVLELQLLEKDFGYKEDATMGNTRLAIMTVAVGVGLLGQFWPGGFPEGSVGIMCCAVVYFVLSNLLSVYQVLVEGDCIFTSLAVREPTWHPRTPIPGPQLASRHRANTRSICFVPSRGLIASVESLFAG
jgi:fatty acid desaturase